MVAGRIAPAVISESEETADTSMRVVQLDGFTFSRCRDLLGLCRRWLSVLLAVGLLEVATV